MKTEQNDTYETIEQFLNFVHNKDIWNPDEEVRQWRRAAIEAMAWIEHGEPRRAFEILSQRFNS